MVCEWYGCGCTLHDDNNEDNEYCIECYNNKEDFLLTASEEMEADGSSVPYHETNEIVYYISSSQYLKPLEEKLNELEQKIHKSIIDAFKEITGDVSDVFTGVFDHVLEMHDNLLNEKSAKTEAKIEENIIINIEEESVVDSSVDEAQVASAAAAEEAKKEESNIDDLLDPVLIARYILGFQIKQHLLTNEYCCVYCEL
jgi:predicted nucleic acid-binding protein